jgi:hypothetical protein
MNRTDADRAGLPAGLELSRNGGKELRPQALIDRLGQAEQQVFFFVGEAQRRHGRLRVGRALMTPRPLRLQEGDDERRPENLLTA